MTSNLRERSFEYYFNRFIITCSAAVLIYGGIGVASSIYIERIAAQDKANMERAIKNITPSSDKSIKELEAVAEEMQRETKRISSQPWSLEEIKTNSPSFLN